MKLPRPGATVRTLGLALTIVVLALAGEWAAAALRGGDEVTCQPPGKSLPVLTGLPEASGVAVSQRTPGVLWTLNDSGEPAVVAIDSAGTVKGRVHLAGAMLRDWEAIAVARCATGGSCLFVGDIGDNQERRSEIVIYRLPEPRLEDKTASVVDVFAGTFPDRPHDTEAMFITADGGMFVITKDKPAAVFKFPDDARPGVAAALVQVGFIPAESVTDAATSPDGRFVAVRTKEEVLFFRSNEISSGGVDHSTPIRVVAMGEPQGEGVAIGGDGTVYLTGEGGGGERPGTLGTLACRFPSETKAARTQAQPAAGAPTALRRTRASR
jgi:hypothetical protein